MELTEMHFIWCSPLGLRPAGCAILGYTIHQKKPEKWAG
jgi:hypothetical protein